MTEIPFPTMNAADAVLGPALARGLAGAPALIHGARTLSYGEVAAQVNRLGHGLRSGGLEPEQRVLLMLRDSPEWVIAYLAAIKVGAVAVPVNLRSSAEDLLFYLTDSRARVLVLDAEFLPLYLRIRLRLRAPPRVAVHGPPGEAALRAADAQRLEDLARGQPDLLEAAPMSPDDMAFWIYTSGTTGTAKAAVHLHHDVLLSDAYLRETLGVTAGTRLYATSKLFFAYALGTCLFGAFRLGATAILSGEWPTPEGVRDTLAAHRPEIVFSVPTLYRNMLRAGVAGEAPFRAVRTFVSAGEKLPEVLYHRWKEATGVEIVEGIGTTETIYMFLTNRPGESRAGSAGRPAPGARVRLVDETGAAVAAPGQRGLLQVSMDSLCDRYWNQQARTRAAFSGPWFSTGDLFTRDGDGQWRHEGRLDDMLKVSGQWVSPTEIEECVLALPQVADAAAIGVSDADGLMRLALVAVPATPGAGGPALEEAIRSALLERLPAHKCPRDIRFVTELPRTASGKVQRFRLRQELAGEWTRG